jgi:hypothetical protein
MVKAVWEGRRKDIAGRKEGRKGAFTDATFANARM